MICGSDSEIVIEFDDEVKSEVPEEKEHAGCEEKRRMVEVELSGRDEDE